MQRFITFIFTLHGNVKRGVAYKFQLINHLENISKRSR